MESDFSPSVRQHFGSVLFCSFMTVFDIIAGKAEGVLFEDDGDGYDFTRGNYLLTYYTAELHSSIVTIKISNTEGSWKRPQRRLHVQLLLGEGAMV